MTTGTHVADFALWLEEDLSLTPTETRIVRVLGLRLGTWLPSTLLAEAVYRRRFIDADLASLRTHIYRVRRKLAGSPWQIDTRYPHGLYRLTARETVRETVKPHAAG